MALLSLRALAVTNVARRSEISPARYPAATDREKDWMSWLPTSFAIYVESRRAASLEYSGSSAIRSAAVWMERLSSSLVVAPSYRPPMVLVATLSTSTLGRSWPQRATARTILLTSTGSSAPLRLRTCIVVVGVAGLPALVTSREVVGVMVSSANREAMIRPGHGIVNEFKGPIFHRP